MNMEEHIHNLLELKKHKIYLPPSIFFLVSQEVSEYDVYQHYNQQLIMLQMLPHCIDFIFLVQNIEHNS